MTNSTPAAELLQAEAELWCHACGYLKSMALQCAIKLGIPNAIHRCGGSASLPELHVALPVAARKRPCLSRIMTFLAASGIFTADPSHGEVASGVRYSLTAASRLLVDDGNVSSGHTCLSRLMLLFFTPLHFRASQSLAEWLEEDEEEEEEYAVAAETTTPFVKVHGESLYSLVRRDAEFGAFFNEAMGADSRFVSRILVRECGAVFAGVTSLVDAGGGDGSTARAIARAFPDVRCTVLELPHVVAAAAPGDDGTVEFVAGDMMEFIPPADAVLLKFVLHNWTDEDCVRILKRSKEAISTREPKGKVIIIDVVLGSSSSKQTLEAQLSLDLCMMVVLPGEQRGEEHLHNIFLEAGFSRYKISPVLGSRSVIEVYP